MIRNGRPQFLQCMQQMNQYVFAEIAYKMKTENKVQGTGLGLSICLLILKRLKGKIWIDDKYTEGARFCFLHPLKSESKLI